MLQERTNVLRNLNANVANIANRQGAANRPARTPTMIWSELLGYRVEEVDERIRARLQLHLDGIVVDAKEGVWVPPQ